MLKNKNKIKQAAKERRQQRTRAKIFGTAQLPRLNVSRSLNHIYAQLIDDEQGKTLVAVHSRTVPQQGSKSDIARAVGLSLAAKAQAKKISCCLFDRGASIYHGRIKAVAEGARAGGLKF